MKCQCGASADASAGASAGALIDLERLLLELGWAVPAELNSSCDKCLTSMINDVRGELSAVQERTVTQMNSLFHVVDSGTESYRMAVERFNSSVNRQVVRVEEIKNPGLHDQFIAACDGDKYEWLFHGSNNSNYVSIAQSGFDMGRSKNGLLGIGVYFADNASYSMSFTHEIQAGDGPIVSNMLLCKVHFKQEDQHGDAIHCIRNDRRAYPQYIIYYS